MDDHDVAVLSAVSDVQNGPCDKVMWIRTNAYLAIRVATKAGTAVTLLS